MSLTKRTYTEKQTVITAKNLNDIQDAIIENEIQKGPNPPINKNQLWLDTNDNGNNLAAYPVGSVYISVLATSPASLFGGTWEQLKDQFLLGAGDLYIAGEKGGEAEHTLTIDEMPSHDHGEILSEPGGNFKRGTYAISQNCQDKKLRTYSTGGNSPHNNMPPYLTVYMWKRVA